MRLPLSFSRTHSSFSYLILTIFYPLLVVTVLGIVIFPTSQDYLDEIVSFGLLSLICYCLTVVSSAVKLRKFLYLASILGLGIFAFIKLSFYFHYDVKISASALFVIFETHGSEASDFINNYLNIGVIGILLLLFIPIIYWLIVLFLRKGTLIYNHNAARSTIKNSFRLITLFGVMGFSFYFIQKNYRPNNILITALGSYKDYLITKENLKENLAQKTNKHLVVSSTSDSPQTHIVIIGESTTNWHMQLYGYQRETNPLLSEIKDELIVFDSVIAPHVHTILSLEKVLTLSNFENKNPENNYSIVQLANAGAYETFWISNQKPVGIHESVTTIIGSAADHQFFLATDDYQNHIYDEKVLPALDSVLSRKDHKKMIFIQLIGTHIAYKKRYPSKFEFFNEKEPLKYTDNNSKALINEYDNAIRYNDSIVRSIIDKVKSEDLNSTVLYFADHGDDVFDVMDYAGHNEYHATRSMFEVPFILWLSEKYKKQHPEFIPANELSTRRYSLEDFIHSFSDLSEIRFQAYDSSRSIFSKDFIRRTRIIKDSINYDERD